MRPGLEVNTFSSPRYPNQRNVCVPKTPLNDFEALPPAIHKVSHGHTDVLVDNFAVTLRRIIVAKNTHSTNDLNARCVGRDNDDALLSVPVRVLRIALAEDEVKSAARVTSTTDVPVWNFSPRFFIIPLESGTYHLWPLITISLPSWRIVVRMFVASEEATARACQLVLSVGLQGRLTETLGHREGGADLTVEEGHKPLLLLLGRSVPCKYLYIMWGMDMRHKNPRIVPHRHSPMLPVSGAEQLTASDATCPPRPRSSAMTPYCAIVSQLGRHIPSSIG